MLYLLKFKTKRDKMSRREQFGTSTPSPVARYYTWSSEDKQFKYYDKESKANINVFPLSVALLTTRSTVRGWHEASKSAIYANEVKNSGKEQLAVFADKGKVAIALGIYRDIKGILQGGHFEKVIYGYEQNVGIVKINIKGSGLKAYSDFEKENNGQKLFENFISVSKFESLKNGAVKYTVPTFGLGDSITKGTEIDKEVEQAYNELDNYFKAKLLARTEAKDNYELDEETGEEDFITSSPELEVAETADSLPF
jgi:hypothetical protein